MLDQYTTRKAEANSKFYINLFFTFYAYLLSWYAIKKLLVKNSLWKIYLLHSTSLKIKGVEIADQISKHTH